MHKLEKKQKLILSKESLRRLSNNELSQIAGGGDSDNCGNPGLIIRTVTSDLARSPR
jgi:hypothetical protein